MTLMLHAGATEVAYDDLRAVATPLRTETHVPIAHHEIVELMRKRCAGSTFHAGA